LPNAWNDKNYRDLLEIMDYGDTSELTPDELKEMCLMSLTDNEPEDAAKIVLEYIFKDRLTNGVLYQVTKAHQIHLLGIIQKQCVPYQNLDWI